MTPENTRKLYASFPRLYRGKDKSQQESGMSWGFDCGAPGSPVDGHNIETLCSEHAKRLAHRDPVCKLSKD